jgi:hypothetical protein
VLVPAFLKKQDNKVESTSKKRSSESLWSRQEFIGDKYVKISGPNDTEHVCFRDVEDRIDIDLPVVDNESWALVEPVQPPVRCIKRRIKECSELFDYFSFTFDKAIMPDQRLYFGTVILTHPNITDRVIHFEIKKKEEQKISF